MKFQAFHVNPGEKLKKKDVNNDLSNFMSVFPSVYLTVTIKFVSLNPKILKGHFSYEEKISRIVNLLLVQQHFKVL